MSDKFSNRKDGFYIINNHAYPSVTTILKVVSKPALIEWAALEGWRIGKKAKNEKELLELFRKISDNAKSRGSDSHQFIENYFKLKSPLPPPSVNPYVVGFKKFINENKVEAIHSETQIYSPKHGYAGTLDLHARVNGVEYIIDFKTNKYGRIYRDVEMQLNAYTNAVYELGLTKTILPTMCVALSPSGYKVKIWKENDIKKFLNIFEVWKWINNYQW
jgi:hypothetical protein